MFKIRQSLRKQISAPMTLLKKKNQNKSRCMAEPKRSVLHVTFTSAVPALAKQIRCGPITICRRIESQTDP